MNDLEAEPRTVHTKLTVPPISSRHIPRDRPEHVDGNLVAFGHRLEARGL